METTESNAVMPMTTPNTVRNERILFSRRVVRAIWAFSRICILMRTLPALDLLAQRFNGLQTRRLPCRIDAEEHTHRRRNQFGGEDCGKGYGHRNSRGRYCQEGNHIRQGNADDPANGGEDGCLDQELQHDVAAASTQCFADSDF